MSTTKVKRGICGICRNRHTQPLPNTDRNDVEYAKRHATPAADALAQRKANRGIFEAAWNDAERAYMQAGLSLRWTEQAWKDGDAATRAVIEPLRDLARHTYCAALIAMWHLPHPSVIRRAKVGCL